MITEEQEKFYQEAIAILESKEEASQVNEHFGKKYIDRIMEKDPDFALINRETVLCNSVFVIGYINGRAASVKKPNVEAPPVDLNHNPYDARS